MAKPLRNVRLCVKCVGLYISDWARNCQPAAPSGERHHQLFDEQNFIALWPVWILILRFQWIVLVFLVDCNLQNMPSEQIFKIFIFLLIFLSIFLLLISNKYPYVKQFSSHVLPYSRGVDYKIYLTHEMCWFWCKINPKIWVIFM